jgi:hypothetical protein
VIDKHSAGQEIGRLIGLDYFPSDPKAIRELVTALTFADTEIIASAVINEWLEGQTQRPTPAALRRMVADHNESRRTRLRDDAEREQQQATYHCALCHDQGFRGGHIGTKYDGPWEWCTCGVGRRKQDDYPGLVGEANMARDKLIETFGATAIPGMVEQFGKRKPHLPDAYFGEF